MDLMGVCKAVLHGGSTGFCIGAVVNMIGNSRTGGVTRQVKKLTPVKSWGQGFMQYAAQGCPEHCWDVDKQLMKREPVKRRYRALD